jgi:predicted dehydrogenase
MASKETLGVGLIGCGNICGAYFKGCAMFHSVEIVACADINMEAAKKAAEEHGVRAVTVDELLAMDEVDIVINLTIPGVHAEVSLKVLEAGKHLHSEKPLAVSLEDGKRVIDTAAAKGLRVGCAPDTFLGAGYQTCRKLIDDGWIGRPLSGSAFMLARGPEGWHPNPAFFYQVGGGPMFDIGPYYMTALVHLLGPVKQVSAVTTKGFETRTATCKEHFGEELPVDVPTHYSGTLVFANGSVVTVGISFDVHRHGHQPIEIYGADGSLQAPDPNMFGGPVRVFRPGNEDWQEVAFSHGYSDNSRGIGVADMAQGILSGRPHRCNGDLAYHVLEIMHAYEKSSTEGKMVEIESTCEQPAALPLGMLPGVLD